MRLESVSCVLLDGAEKGTERPIKWPVIYQVHGTGDARVCHAFLPSSLHQVELPAVGFHLYPRLDQRFPNRRTGHDWYCFVCDLWSGDARTWPCHLWLAHSPGNGAHVTQRFVDTVSSLS